MSVDVANPATSTVSATMRGVAVRRPRPDPAGIMMYSTRAADRHADPELVVHCRVPSVRGGALADEPPACVAALGIATIPWERPPSGGLIPNEPFADAAGATRAWDAPRRRFRHAWDVTAHVRRQLARPEDASLRHGYVLRGAQEALDADEYAACMSTLAELRLEVRYPAPRS
jgi:hypothetical protein